MTIRQKNMFAYCQSACGLLVLVYASWLIYFYYYEFGNAGFQILIPAYSVSWLGFSIPPIVPEYAAYYVFLIVYILCALSICISFYIVQHSVQYAISGSIFWSFFLFSGISNIFYIIALYFTQRFVLYDVVIQYTRISFTVYLWGYLTFFVASVCYFYREYTFQFHLFIATFLGASLISRSLIIDSLSEYSLLSINHIPYGIQFIIVSAACVCVYIVAWKKNHNWKQLLVGLVLIISREANFYGPDIVYFFIGGIVQYICGIVFISMLLGKYRRINFLSTV